MHLLVVHHWLWCRARKIVNLRLFDDENGKPWEKSVADVNYEILCVSQVGSRHILNIPYTYTYAYTDTHTHTHTHARTHTHTHKHTHTHTHTGVCPFQVPC